MALSDDTINRYADACTPNTETGSLNYKAFASAIEAEVRKQDTELIQQMLDALENASQHTDRAFAWKDGKWQNQRTAAITAARARLEGKP